MEVVEEEELTMGKSSFGNARFEACIEPPRRPAQPRDCAGPSDVLHFASD